MSRIRKHCPPSVLATVALLVAGLPAQGRQADPVELQDLARRLRDPALDETIRARIVERLLDAGHGGALLLFNRCRDDYIKGLRAWTALRRKHVKAFDKAARKAVRARSRKAKGKIRDLQKRSVAISRTQGLAKPDIKRADEVHAALSELIEVFPSEVLKADDRVAAIARELERSHTRLAVVWGMRRRAATALAESPNGSRHLAKQKPLVSPDGLLPSLREAYEWVCLLAMPMSSRDRRTLERNLAVRDQIERSEYDGILILNRIRLRAGLPALAIDVKLCKAGRDHSSDMVRLGFFAHRSPVAGKTTPGQRAALAGTSGGAENIAMGQRSAEGAIRAWWYSPGHHRNMMRSSGRVGLGRHRNHWTQMFGG